MPRNFYRRIELVFPVEDPDLRRRIVEDYLPLLWQDSVNARELQPNGAYLPVRPDPGSTPMAVQPALIACHAAPPEPESGD